MIVRSVGQLGLLFERLGFELENRWASVTTIRSVLFYRLDSGGVVAEDVARSMARGLVRGDEGVYIMYKQGATAMKATVQKWGNSLGIRIPRTLALEVSLETDSEVDLSARDGTIVISPTRQKRPSLRQLLSKVTDSNLHAEIPSGKAKGGEAW